jgi:hypothetical protein
MSLSLDKTTVASGMMTVNNNLEKNWKWPWRNLG